METKITLTTKAGAHRAVADLLVAGVHAEDSKRAAELDRRLGGAAGRGIEKTSARLGSCFVVDTMGQLPARAVAVAGLGEKENFSRKNFSATGNYFKAASAAVKAAGGGQKKIVFDFPGLSSAADVRAVIEGALLGAYKFEKYKGGAPHSVSPHGGKPRGGKPSGGGADTPEHIAVVSSLSAAAFKDAARLALATVKGVRLCRDLVNEPPMSLTPSALASEAKKMCAEEGLDCTVITPEEMEKRGMGGLLAVGGGSANPPRLIHMIYRPPSAKGARKVAIVGKGITFDSGGLSLKPADSMKGMKMDMAGAAAVIGAMKAVSAAAPRAEVHGIVASAENMTGPAAYRPDDIVTPMNGKTVEIGNTDAEGRVVLADALSYAVELGAKEIVDLATLTGACVVALGVNTAAVMGNSPEVVKKILRSAAVAGESVWELPLSDDLRKDIESDVADIKNVGGRAGGAITAALFLEHFVSETPWAHLDIAGPAFADKGNDWQPKGATGFGVRTLLGYLSGK